jgi:hypothetical protein
MIRGRSSLRFFAVALIALVAAGALAQSPSGDSLVAGFQNPPDSAKPRVWWHWMNGNVTKEGITADLEWMKRSGIAGMQMFDGNLGTPQFVDKRLVWMTPDWKDAFRHSGAEADRLGLEMAMAASGGWSETAGPWVKPEEAMKKLVWSELRVQGPKKFAGSLPHPPTNNGRFQNLPAPADLEFPTDNGLSGTKSQPKAPPAPPDPTYYADAAVIAYRVPGNEVHMADLHPKITSSASRINSAALIDGDLSKNVLIPYEAGGKPSGVQFEFAQPFGTRAFSIAAGAGSTFGGASIPTGEVEASQDGTKWVTLVTLPGTWPCLLGLSRAHLCLPGDTCTFLSSRASSRASQHVRRNVGIASRAGFQSS